MFRKSRINFELANEFTVRDKDFLLLSVTLSSLGFSSSLVWQRALKPWPARQQLQNKTSHYFCFWKNTLFQFLGIFYLFLVFYQSEPKTRNDLNLSANNYNVFYVCKVASILNWAVPELKLHFWYDTHFSALNLNWHRYQPNISTLQMKHTDITYFVVWSLIKGCMVIWVKQSAVRRSHLLRWSVNHRYLRRRSRMSCVLSECLYLRFRWSSTNTLLISKTVFEFELAKW